MTLPSLARGILFAVLFVALGLTSAFATDAPNARGTPPEKAPTLTTVESPLIPYRISSTRPDLLIPYRNPGKIRRPASTRR
jgi:hypothetical protein